MTPLSSQPQTSGIRTFRSSAYLLLCLLSLCLLAAPLVSAAGMTDVQKAKIKADLAAKKPLEQIMKEALALCMPASDLVTTLIKAGVEPGAVVTAAVSASSIVIASEAGCHQAVIPESITAAVKAGGAAALPSIVRAAENSGVSTPVILKAATAGGADSETVTVLASTSSAASAPEAPALGYSAPAPTTGPTTYQPSGTPAMGGGGGGAPVNPTQPASPTNPNVQRR